MSVMDHNLFITLLLRTKAETVLVKQPVISKQKCIDYIEK